MSLLGGLLIGAGQGIQGEQAYNMNEAAVQGAQQQVITQKLQNQSLQQDIQDQQLLRQSLGQLQAGTANFQDLQKMEQKAVALGQYKVADSLSHLMSEQQQDNLLNLKENALKKAALANAVSENATDFLANPTDGARNALVKSYLANGGDPKALPKSPTDFIPWARSLQLTGMSPDKKATVMAQMAALQNRQTKEEELSKYRQIELALRTLDTAVRQAGIYAREQANKAKGNKIAKMGDLSYASSSPESISALQAAVQKHIKNPSAPTDINPVTGQPYPASHLEWLSKNTEANAALNYGGVAPVGIMLTPAQLTQQQILGDAAQGLLGIKAVLGQQTGTVASVLNQTNGHTVTEQLTKMINSGTASQSAQITDVVTKSLGLDISKIATLLGGRGANQVTINEFQDIATPKKGDTNMTVLLKMAYVGDIIRSRINQTVSTANEQETMMAEQQLKELEGLPTSEEILRVAASDHKDSNSYMSLYKRLKAATGKLTSGASGSIQFGTPGE